MRLIDVEKLLDDYAVFGMANISREDVRDELYDLIDNQPTAENEYNQALKDVFNLAKQNSYDDGVDYSIGLQKLDELITNIRK